MQRHLPKIVLAAFLFSVFYFSPKSINALTQIKSSVTLKQNSTSSNESINQSTRIQISTDGDKTTIVNVTSAPTPTKNVTSSSGITPTVTSVRSSLSASPTPTKSVPTVTQKLSITPTKIPTPQIVSGDVKQYIMKAINDYRKTKGLGMVQTSLETCSFAKIRAKEISISFNHDGFRNRINNKTIPYKSWSLVTENLAMTSNYKNVVNMWIASVGHEQNLRKDTPYICVENYGNYYAYEGMKS